MLPGLRVFPAPGQLSCSRSPSGAGRLKTAGRRPASSPCCPAGNHRESTENVEDYSLVINSSAHARYAACAHVRWRLPPRKAAWEMKFSVTIRYKSWKHAILCKKEIK